MDAQLVQIKRLYQTGCDFAERGDAFSAGVAISLFQDAAEGFIRYLLRQIDGSTSDFPRFTELIGAVKNAPGNASGLDLPCKQKLRNLNAARISFKHEGVLPDPSQASKYQSFTLEFLSTSCSMFLDGLDFDQISLIDLIPYTDVREQLKEAGTLSIKGEWLTAACRCSQAHGMLLCRLHQYVPIPNLDSHFGTFLPENDRLPAYATGFLGGRCSDLHKSHTFVVASALGLPVKKYADTICRLPAADIMDSGEWHFRVLNSVPLDRMLVESAVDLVTMMALKTQEFLGDG